MITVACHSGKKETMETNGAFMKAKNKESVNIDRIVNSGELIITTLNGPDTYFDYQGCKLGLQYALVENFANTLGVSVRVELSADTTEMIRKLQTGEVDLIAFQLPSPITKETGLQEAGAFHTKNQTSWAIRSDEKDLKEELNFWYSQDIEIVVSKVETRRIHARRKVQHKVNAPFISREKGIISIYDNLFKKAAQHIGWDWKLLAAQCYQESGFDPNAVSYMGAQGLMQIMPTTAQHLNVQKNRIFIPSDNIEAASRYIGELQNYFSSIRDHEERIKFILASYNGGAGHITDAQALTRKYGKNANKWEDVSQFVLKLSNPRYYRDPVVKHGYMISNETYHYVSDILRRWRSYGGTMRSITNSPSIKTDYSPLTIGTSKKLQNRKKNRYSKEQKIFSMDELGHK